LFLTQRLHTFIRGHSSGEECSARLGGPVGEKMLIQTTMRTGAAALALLALSGCAGQQIPGLNSSDPGQRAMGGAVVGAGTGALAGGLIGGWEGAGIGAATGAVFGAVVGAATTPSNPGPQAAAYPAPAYQPPSSGYSGYQAQPSYAAPSSYPANSSYPPPVVQR
jgi:hypothetical protein